MYRVCPNTIMLLLFLTTNKKIIHFYVYTYKCIDVCGSLKDKSQTFSDISLLFWLVFKILHKKTTHQHHLKRIHRYLFMYICKTQ